jgi:protein SCO1/2
MISKKYSLPSNPFWLALIGLIMGLVIALATYAIGRALRPPQILRGAQFDPAVPAVDFTLEEHVGKFVSLYDYRGAAILLSFTCRACPGNSALMNKLTQARNMATSNGYDTQVVLININPEQETPDVFADFVQSYDPNFTGLSGDLRDIQDIAHSYDVYFHSHEENDDSRPENTLLIMLIDQSGYWRSVYPLGMAAEDIARDIRVLSEEK